MSARVLIVAHNPKIGGLISAQLREKSSDAVSCTNGAEAAGQLRKQTVDVILMDNGIKMGGVKPARILRLHEKYNTIPVVRTMEIAFGGDPLIPEMDPYASRLQKSVEEIVQHRDDFTQQCDSILGA